MAAIHEAMSPTLKLVLQVTALFGVLLFAGGIYLATRAAAATTTIKMLGYDFSSSSVGVTFAFLGVVVAIYSIKKVVDAMNAVNRM